MSGRRYREIAISLLLALACSIALAASPEPLPSRGDPNLISTLRQRLSSTSSRRSRVQQRLRQVKRQQANAQVRLNTVRQKLERTRQQFLEASARLHSTRAELDRASQNLASTQARLQKHEDAFSRRLVFFYERGEAGFVEVLLGATSFSDLANRGESAQMLVAADTDLLARINEQRDLESRYRRQVQAKTVAVNNWRREVAQKKSQVTVQKDQVTAAVADLRKERSRLEREYATLEQNSREITSYLRQVQGTTSGRQRMQKPYSGTFTRPVPGAISSSFGSRMHPILRVRKMHTGVDMRASSGTPIRAAGDGTVVRAERWGGYGNCIIIDHGGGTATVYAHCSRMSVRSGQAVKRGQTIGAVGSTGLSTGPHLHFEVRRNGSPVNPASYIN